MRSKPDKIGAQIAAMGYKGVVTNDHIFHPYERR